MKFEVYHMMRSHRDAVPFNAQVGGNLAFARETWLGNTPGVSFKLAATLEAAEAADPMDALDTCYENTNHISDSMGWSSGKAVPAPGPQRSTSVGDVIMDGSGKLWLVMGMGFEELRL